MITIRKRFQFFDPPADYPLRVRRSEEHAKLSSLFVALCFLLASGCGYTLQGRADLPFQSVAIGKMINRTFEPRLEDRMQTALVDELLKSGFLIDGSSGYKIIGNLTSFDLKTLSEKSGVALEYEVTIGGDFRLIDPSGKARQLRNRGVFIVSFPSTGGLQDVVALKEQATEKALRDLSVEIVASIIYGR
ncbi:MAG: LPS assembly lipoprotein LptE [Nitrospirae bacterium]|nr:LPS assembly lipoprotein LptE [Nitrospirota bacterium]